MRGSSAVAVAGGLLAVAGFAAALALPLFQAPPSHPPAQEIFRGVSCGGDDSCARLQEVQRLAEILEERMDTGERERRFLASAIAEESDAAGIDPLFVLALIQVESRFDTGAASSRGARGLMQLLPATFERELERSDLAGASPGDPVVNVRAGIRYYARLLRDFRHDHELALMAYNAGPQRISRLRREDGGVPERYRAYPRRVAIELRRLRGEARMAMAEGAAPAVP